METIKALLAGIPEELQKEMLEESKGKYEAKPKPVEALTQEEIKALVDKII